MDDPQDDLELDEVSDWLLAQAQDENQATKDHIVERYEQLDMDEIFFLYGMPR